MSSDDETQGLTLPSVGAHTYTEGANVTVYPVPKTGFEWVKWQLNGVDWSTENPTITMDSNKTAIAYFQIALSTIQNLFISKPFLDVDGFYKFFDESLNNNPVTIKNTHVITLNGTGNKGIQSQAGKFINGGTPIDLTLHFKAVDISVTQYLFSCGGLVAGQKGFLVSFNNSKITIWSNDGVTRVFWQSPDVTGLIVAGVNALQFIWDGVTVNGGATVNLNGTEYNINVINPWSGTATYPNLLGWLFTSGSMQGELHYAKLVDSFASFEYDMTAGEGVNIPDLSENDNTGTIIADDLPTLWGGVSDVKKPIYEQGYSLFKKDSDSSLNRQSWKNDGTPATLAMTGYKKIAEIPRWEDGLIRTELKIIVVGNSIDLGTVAAGETVTVAERLQTLLDDSSYVGTVVNAAISGQSGTQMVNDFIANVYPLYDAKKINIVVGGEFTNDLFGGGKTPTQAYDNLITYFSKIAEMGITSIWRLGTPTSADTNPTPFDGWIEEANDMVRANQGAANHIIDPFTDSYLSNLSNYTDGTHPDSSQGVADLAWTKLNEIIPALLISQPERAGFSNSGNTIEGLLHPSMTGVKTFAEVHEKANTSTYINQKTTNSNYNLTIKE
jgi:hypothetical protein